MNNNSTYPVERHPWLPFTPHNAKILILGTFPPKPNRWSMEFYYPNRINDFWRIMGLIFHNDKNYFYDESSKSFRLNDITSFLENKGIAIGDSAFEIKRLKDNASDKHLEIVTPLNLEETLNLMPFCHNIASTGEKAAQIIAQITNSEVPSVGQFVSTDINNCTFNIFRMPSTSRAYPLPIEQKAQFYQNMFQMIGIL